MRPSFAIALSLLALAVALLSLSTSATGSMEPGVVADDVGGIVRDVDPDGFAWQEGVRPGQRVVELVRADQAGGWALETTDGVHAFRVNIQAAEASLRVTAAAGLAAVVLALLGLATARTRRRRAELLAVLGIVFAALPFAVVHVAPVGQATLLGAGIAPVVWIARWLPMRTPVRIALVSTGGAIAIPWLLHPGGVQPLGNILNQAWGLAIIAGTVAMVAVGTGMTPTRVLQTIAAIRVVDAAVIAAAAIVVVGLFVFGLPPVFVVVVVLLPLATYARARATIGQMLDRLLLAELRERAAIHATEEERARLSREIHDSPLQAIAGVIQQLEQQPDTSAARDSLRSVAAQLRTVATDLHPPVLDDLGLVPALEGVVRQATGDIEATMTVTNETGYTRSERPPPDVELAVYRIVQEALTNAARHSGGSHVIIEGLVAPTRIDLDVVDDGVGIDESRIDAAMRAGHMGVASMRRRAAAIDAQLEHVALQPRGTRVSVRWSG